MAACSSRRNRSASHRRHQGSAAAPWHRKANRATHRPGPGEYNGKPAKRHVGLHVAGEQLSTSSMSKDDGRWPCLGGTTASRWSGSIGFHRPASCRVAVDIRAVDQPTDRASSRRTSHTITSSCIRPRCVIARECLSALNRHGRTGGRTVTRTPTTDRHRWTGRRAGKRGETGRWRLHPGG